MITQSKDGAGDSAADKPKKKAVPDMGRGSREQMFKPQKATPREPPTRKRPTRKPSAEASPPATPVGLQFVNHFDPSVPSPGTAAMGVVCNFRECIARSTRRSTPQSCH